VIAARCARWAYRWLDRPAHYAEPIVGSIAWQASSKLRDYAAPLALVAGFLVALAIASAVSARLQRTVGAAAADRLDALLLVASAPAGAWLAGLLTTKAASFTLVNASVACVALVLATAALLSARAKAFWQGDVAQFSRVLGEALLVLPGAWLGVSAVAVGLSRLRALRHGSPLGAASVESATAVVALAAAVGLVLLVLLAGTTAYAERTLRRSLLLLQVAFPAFFLLLVPRPWLVDRHTEIGYPLSGWAWLLVGALVAASYADLARRARRASRAVPDDPFALISTMSLVGVVLFLKAAPVGLPSVSADDYHFGEMLVPWWSFAHQQMLPFADYSPARGFVNYLPGAAAALFFDGTAASFSAVWPFVYVGILLLAVPVLRWSMSAGWAALALLLAMPANGIPLSTNGLPEIDVLVTLFLAIACRGLAGWRPSRWIVAWVLVGTALVLLAPGQGGLAILATSPLGLWMAVRGLSEERRALLRTLSALAAGAVVVGLTPVGRVVLGATRYGAEQSAVNSVAHGIAWAASFGTSDVNPWLYEMMRASWLLVALWAGVLLVEAARARRAGEMTPALPYAISILVLATLFVFRAAGRIDAGPSRLGLASMWALALLLPLLLHAATSPGRRGGAVLAWVSLAGLVLPHFGGLSTHFAHAFEPIRGVPAALTERHAAALPPLGNGTTDPTQIARLSALRTVVDRVLDPGETYLDLSSRQAHYFYLQRRPPIETGSPYNLVTESQQRRAIAALRRAPPPAVLLSADNFVFDGGPLGLRSHLLYRHVLQLPGYAAVVTGGQVWLLREDRIPRLSREGAPAIAHEVHGLDDRSTSPVHRILQVQELGAVPASWGASAASLEGAMRLVHPLPASAPASPSAVEALGDGRFRVVGPHPRVGFDLSGWHLRGRDAGILSLDFHCERAGGPPPVLELRWASASNAETELTRVRFDGRDGRLIVPLDASPAWLLASEIRSLGLELTDERSCRSFRVADARLLQRHGVEPARPPDAQVAN
jgi:hypothetical protein